MAAAFRQVRVIQLEREEDHLLSEKDEGSEDGLYIPHKDSQRPSTPSPHLSFAKLWYLLLLLFTNLASIFSTYRYSENHFRRTFSPDFVGGEYSIRAFLLVVFNVSSRSQESLSRSGPFPLRRQLQQPCGQHNQPMDRST